MLSKVLAGEAVAGGIKECLDEYQVVPLSALENSPQREAWRQRLLPSEPVWEVTDDEPVLSMKTTDDAFMDRLEEQFKDMPGVTIKRSKGKIVIKG